MSTAASVPLQLRRTLLSLVLLSGCVHPAGGPAAVGGSPPSALLGRFQDDYGNHFQITPDAWVQLPHGQFHIKAWHAGEQYLIAQNDSSSGYAPGRWTRIDWMSFSGMAPYTWGFCLTAYDAPSAAAAEAAAPANRAAPRSGCNGYPFSRMRPDSVLTVAP